MLIIQPNHLCARSRVKISTAIPPGDTSSAGCWPCVVKIFAFPTLGQDKLVGGHPSSYGPGDAWNNIEIGKLHCQPSRQPVVETCPGVGDGTKNKNWKTKKHIGLANANALLHCRWKCLGEWSTTAFLTDVWLTHMIFSLTFRRRNSES